MEAEPGVTFTYNPTGSGSGIQAVQEGRCDIGLSSRALKDEEKAAGLTETILCYAGIAIIVNPANKVENLTIAQIADIYTGKITNWSAVGGDDSEIVRQPEAVFSHVVAVGHARSAVKKQNDRIFVFRSPNVNRLSKPAERHALLAVYRISAHRKHLTCINNLIVAPFGAQTNKQIIKNGAARTGSPKI